jgi:OTU domain-containing protein 3
MTTMLVQVLRDVRGDSDVAIEYLIAEASGDASSTGSYESDPESSTATGTCLYLTSMT